MMVTWSDTWRVFWPQHHCCLELNSLCHHGQHVTITGKHLQVDNSRVWMYSIACLARISEVGEELNGSNGNYSGFVTVQLNLPFSGHSVKAPQAWLDLKTMTLCAVTHIYLLYFSRSVVRYVGSGVSGTNKDVQVTTANAQVSHVLWLRITTLCAFNIYVRWVVKSEIQFRASRRQRVQKV